MTLDELQVQLDISSGNELEVLKQHAYVASYGYLFIDSSDGQCYLFNKYGKINDIKTIENIENVAYCTSLKSIIIPNSVMSIEDGAFYYCTSLKSIIIPDSVKSIGKWAFGACTSLESITIPDSVKSIGKWTFSGCISLREIIFKGKTIDQVNTMANYPWDITDASIIKCK